MRKRGLLSVLVVLMLAFALTVTGCGGQSGGASSDKTGEQPQEVPTLNVSYIFTNHQTPFVVAMYQGEKFKDKGTYLKEVVPKEKYELYSDGNLVCKINVITCLCQDLVGGTPGLRKIIFILSREGSNLGDFP